MPENPPLTTEKPEYEQWKELSSTSPLNSTPTAPDRVGTLRIAMGVFLGMLMYGTLTEILFLLKAGKL